MATTVATLMQDIIHRVGKKVLAENGEAYILRAMNRIYKRVNEDLGILEREWHFVFSAGDQKLGYSAKTAAFNVGATLTGATSGATGTILAIRDDGDNTGDLILHTVTGTFQSGEAITDNGSTPGAATTAGANVSAKSIALPSDFLRAIRMAPYRKYRDPQVYSENEKDTMTVIDQRLHASNVDNTTAFLIHYLSVGKELVRTVSDATTQVNAPEWPEQYRQFLLYATAIELSDQYGMYQRDVWQANKLQGQLHSLRSLKDEHTPGAYNPYERSSDPTSLDDYGLSEFI
jgi:hypothetical protein